MLYMHINNHVCVVLCLYNMYIMCNDTEPGNIIAAAYFYWLPVSVSDQTVASL